MNREIASKKLTLDNQKIFRIVGILPDDKREVYVQASEFLSESLKIDNSSDLVSKFKKLPKIKMKIGKLE